MVFVDSNIFISLWDQDNVNHQKAVEKSLQLEKQGEELVISNMVIYEVATVLSMRVAKAKALDFLSFVEEGKLEVIFIDEQIDNLAHKIFEKVRDKNVSFFDCISFALIERLNISTIFSFDKDFIKYGKSLGWDFV